MQAARELWERYDDTGDATTRNRIVEENLRLVHHVAHQMIGARGGQGDLDDLVSAGTIGLLEAVEKFDPSRGLAFSTYAAPRIRGAMLDDGRRRDHVPRSVRRKQRDLRSARNRLGHLYGRPPRDEEVARDLEVDLETVWQWDLDVCSTSIVSIDGPVSEPDDRSTTLEEVLCGEEGSAIEDTLTFGEELGIVRRALEDLTDQQRKVLALYHFEELKLHEIASLMGLTESRISQIRSQALAVLRTKLGHLRAERV